MPTKPYFITILAFFAACGPKTPGDSDSAADTTGEESTSSTSEDPGAGSSSTDPVEPTTDPTTGDPTTGDPTTGESTGGDELTCPVGQPSLAPLWSTTLPLSTDPEIWAGRWIGVVGDGRIAVEGFTRTKDDIAPGLFWTGGNGGAAAWTPGQLAPGFNLENAGLRVAADDSVVLVGWRETGVPPTPFVSRFAPGGAELTRVDIQTTDLNHPREFALDGDAVVVAGLDLPDANHWLAHVDIATGVPDWEIQLPSTALPGSRHVAVGPAGEVVAGHGHWPNNNDPEFKLWRVDDAGAIVWERDLLPQGPGGGILEDLAFTPDGVIVALTKRRVTQSVDKLVATGLSLADGATLWELDVAPEDESGEPFTRGVLVDADALTIVAGHTPSFWNGGVADPLTVVVYRVSFDGVHLGATPLVTDDINKRSPYITAARGACGDLVLFQNDFETPWLAAFAP